ncbi:MAG: hypothetical protein Q8K60_08920 [Parachlamydiaceae bacterium]|nr:hypothetical protein [Parachlamydiaceae bacterium]
MSNLFYDEFNLNSKNQQNLDYLSSLTDPSELKETKVDKNTLQKEKKIFNVFSSNVPKKEVLGTIYDSFVEMDKKLKSDPFLPSKQLEKIQKAIQNVSGFIEQNLISEKEVKIKDKFFNTINSIQQHVSQIREKSGLEWVEKTNPDLFDEIKACDEKINNSENKALPLDQRIKLAPKPLSENRGASGSHIQTGLKESFIIKPSEQEYSVDFPGYPVGTNVIRERVAYSLQNIIELNCGVPPTLITTMAHSNFEKDNQIELNLKKFGVPLSRQKFFELIKDQVNTFRPILINYQNQIINDLIKDEGVKKEIIDYLDGKNNEPSQEARNGMNLNPHLFNDIKLSRSMSEEEFNSLSAKTFNLLNDCEKGKPGVVSCQLMMKNCLPVNALSDEDKVKINPKEYEKFVIDLMLLNSDRHMGNALVHPTTKEQLLSRLENHQIDIHQLSIVLDHNLEFNSQKDVSQHTQDLLEFLSYDNKNLVMTDEIEKTISNLVFLSVNKHDFIFELVMIDHGNCLPTPEQDIFSNSSLTTTEHKWVESLPVDKTVMTGMTKDKILGLDIMQTVNRLEQEIGLHEIQFGNSCKMDPKCYDLLRINLLCLQKGVELNFNLKQLNNVFEKSPDKKPPLVKTIYEEVEKMQNRNGQVDWNKINTMIDNQIT